MNETDSQASPFAPSSLPPPTEGNGQATASMVLGIVSFVLCGPFCSIPAVILGHISLGKIRRGVVSQDARGFALAGTLLGWINLVLVAIGIIAMLFMMGLAALSSNAGHVSPFIYRL